MSNAMLIAADLDAMFPPGFHSHAFHHHAATVKTAAQMLREQDKQIEELRVAMAKLMLAADSGIPVSIERNVKAALAVLEQTAR